MSWDDGRPRPGRCGDLGPAAGGQGPDFRFDALTSSVMRLRVLVDDRPLFNRTLLPTERVCIGKAPEDVCLDVVGHLHVSAGDQDVKLSRLAVVVAGNSGTGWRADVTNFNGVDVQAWGQAPYRAPEKDTVTIAGRHVALWLRGDRSRRYLVLCEPLEFEVRKSSRGQNDTQRSEADDLSVKEIEAIRTVFAEHLQWPPVRNPEIRTKPAAANRLGITTTALNDRLANALEKAKRIGYVPPGRQQAPTSDATWVSSLVSAHALTFGKHALSAG